MTNKQVKINKTKLSYELFESKNKNSDTIIILHGWQWASSSWTETWDLLNREGYNVIIPDIPCASKLTNCNDVFNLDQFAELIEEFVLELKEKYKNFNFDNLILWWHSNGGAISIKLANSWNIKIKRLILNNSAWIRNDNKRSIKRKIFNNIVKPLKLIKKIPWSNKLRELFYRWIWSQDYLKAEQNPKLKQTYLNMISSDLKEEIKNLKLNTLLIWWEKDTYTPISDAYFMRENIKNSKLIILDNQTHWIHLKNPKKLVENFLNNI